MKGLVNHMQERGFYLTSLSFKRSFELWVENESEQILSDG